MENVSILSILTIVITLIGIGILLTGSKFNEITHNRKKEKELFFPD